MKVPSIHHEIVIVIFALSIAFNTLLIWLILRHTRSHLQIYSRFMLSFAIFNILYPTLCFVTTPVIFSYGYGFFMFCTNPFVMYSKFLSAAGLLIYASAYAQSLALLCFHFIYRYSLICRMEVLRNMDKKKIIMSMVIFYVFIAGGYGANAFIFLYDSPVVIHDFTEPLLEIFDANIQEISSLGCIYFTYLDGQKTLNLKSWIGMGVCMTVISSAFAIIFFCGSKIFATLKGATMSKRTRKLQMSLFKALVIQTVVPVIFEYGPAGVILLLPTVNMAVDTTFATVSFGVYSFVEPLAMIYFITDYRNAMLRHSCLPTGISTSLMSADLNATETAAESKSKTMLKWPLIFRSLRVRPKIATHVLKVVVIS